MRTAPNIIQTLLTLCLTNVAISSEARGQSARVGYIDDVRGAPTYPGQGCVRKWAIAGSREWLSVARGSLEQPAWPMDSVMPLDRIRVRRPANVRVRLNSKQYGEGTLFLSPELGRCAEVTLTDTGDGSYAISTRREGSDANGPERLVVSTENGAAYVEWTRGLLSVVALGREIQATGAEFAVLADSATNRAILYVQKGVVTMPDVVDLQAVAGSSFLIHREGRPEPFKLNSEFVKDAMYQARVVWTQDTHEAAPKTSGGGEVVIVAVVVVVVVVALAAAAFNKALEKQCFPLGCDVTGFYQIAAARSGASLGTAIVAPGIRAKGRP